MLSKDDEYTLKDEEYLHLQECLNCLNVSWTILNSLEETAPLINEEETTTNQDQKATTNLIRAAAFRLALIEYIKPYTQSQGKIKRKHYLKFPLESMPEVELHNLLMNLRNEVLAHTDIKIKEPKVYKKNSEKNGPSFTLNTAPNLPTGSAVIELIEKSLDVHYATLESLALSYNQKP